MQIERLTFVLTVSFCWIASTLWAGTNGPVKLEDLMAEALKNNPEIQAAHNAVLAAKALAPQAWGLDNPMLRLENENAHRNPFDSQQAEQNRIGFTQAIPFPAKLFGRSAVAAKELASAQAKYDQTVNGVIRDVKATYSELFLALRIKELLEESRQALDSFRDVANRKYSIGKASQADVLGAEVEMGKVLNEITMQEAQVIAAQATLKALLNRSGDDDFSLPKTHAANSVGASVSLRGAKRRSNPVGINEIASSRVNTLGTRNDSYLPVEDLVMKSQQMNPALRSSQAEVDKAVATLDLAKLEYAPDVEIMTEFRQVDGGPDVWDGFLGVSIPLWAWKQQGMIAQAKSLMDQKKNDWDTQKNKTIRDVREAYARVQSTRHIVENLTKIVIPQAEQTLKISETAYENDKIDFSTLVGYWRILLGYRMDLQKAMSDYEIAMADLDRAVGNSGT